MPTFVATVLLGGKTATGIRVPPEVVDELGVGKRPAVNVTLRGYSYRTTVAVMGGEFMIPLAAEHREKAGLAAGDDVEVTLTIDDAPRTVDVPDDLAAELKKEPDARAFFESLSYSQQLAHATAVGGAKKPETRARRLQETMEMLREKRRR